jgi:hypothetical protein
MSINTFICGNKMSFGPKEGKKQLVLIFSITYHNIIDFITSLVIPLRAL